MHENVLKSSTEGLGLAMDCRYYFYSVIYFENTLHLRPRKLETKLYIRKNPVITNIQTKSLK
jgi:hypothetical protein